MSVSYTHLDVYKRQDTVFFADEQIIVQKTDDGPLCMDYNLTNHKSEKTKVMTFKQSASAFTYGQRAPYRTCVVPYTARYATEQVR